MRATADLARKKLDVANERMLDALALNTEHRTSSTWHDNRQNDQNLARHREIFQSTSEQVDELKIWDTNYG